MSLWLVQSKQLQRSCIVTFYVFNSLKINEDCWCDVCQFSWTLGFLVSFSTLFWFPKWQLCSFSSTSLLSALIPDAAFSHWWTKNSPQSTSTYWRLNDRNTKTWRVDQRLKKKRILDFVGQVELKLETHVACITCKIYHNQCIAIMHIKGSSSSQSNFF